MHRTALAVDDHASTRLLFEEFLHDEGFRVTAAADGRAARVAMRHARFDVAFVDLRLPDCDGLGLLRDALAGGGVARAVLVSGEATVPVAVDAMRAGAAAVLEKPLSPDALRRVMRDLFDGRPPGAAEARARRLAPEMVGEDPRLLEVFGVIERIADTECTVLVTGESGTGKELVARAVHRASGRAHGPFVAVNCAAVPRDLIESELFGHARGAFTGATQAREGRFVAAAGGTLFLDEVGEMDPAMQCKLLRVVQDGEVTPVGESRPTCVDVRVVAATNRDLERDCREGRFREDLYWRLNVIPVHLPPLRERPGDVPALADHFVRAFNRRRGRRVAGLSDAVRRALGAYPWPGNVRQLENTIERLVVLKGEGTIDLEDLPAFLCAGACPSGTFGGVELPSDGLDLQEALDRCEEQLIRQALERTGGNKARAAALLQINRTTLVEKLRRARPQQVLS